VTGPARLQALRVQGFKSFADRTVIEFVPGINAVVGPNGSGKSNLADALRWALGEQGRALRSRRAEDVVFAGSERRSALGMADVALLLDNGDGLLPVEFRMVEIGRRLFRSGENEYLLNRQRVRLRDLIELLESAHLADNAFLFIGQGMVDEALALRPEERRGLFEEVAGVRRHERRRRRAEEQLAEATTNLARVEDILNELRPQLRRLASQAEQQASRTKTEADLAQAIVAHYAARWHAAASAARDAETALAGARRRAASALAALQAAEGAAASAARVVAGHVAAEAQRRAAHEGTRSALAAIDLEVAAEAAETAALRRERARLTAEREAALVDLATHRRTLALPVAPPDDDLDLDLADLDRALAEARAEIEALRAEGLRRSEADGALRRAAAAQVQALDSLRRRARAAEAAASEAAEAARAAAAQAASAEAALAQARRAVAAAATAEAAARERSAAAAEEQSRLEAARGVCAEALAAARSREATLRGRLDALRARLRADESRAISAAVRRAGGRPLADGLDVDPARRRAVAVALGELGGSFVVGRAGLDRLAGQRGTIVLSDAVGAGARHPSEGEIAAARTAAARHGGGLLTEAVRADPGGVARRLLARWAWAPSLSAAVDLAAELPVGWRAVASGAGAAGSDGVVVLGTDDAPFDRRLELDALEADLAAAAVQTAEDAERREAAEVGATAARASAEAARRAAADAGRALRQAGEAERAAERRAEQAAREAAWAAARDTSLAREAGPLTARLAEVEEAAEAAQPKPLAVAGAEPAAVQALAVWEARLAEIASRREAVAAARAARDDERRAAEATRMRAAAAAELAEERLARAEAEAAELVAREAELEAAAAAREGSRAEAAARETRARAELEAVRAADAAGRSALAAAEAAVAAAREDQRRAEGVLRAAEVRGLEARLAIDALREQVLVDLAVLGESGLRAIAPAADQGSGMPPAPPALNDVEGGAAVSAVFAAASARWAATTPAAEPPSAARLASLRRRFHELGAANPHAAGEHDELRARVDGLEEQRADLVRAIDRTRALMDELDALIAHQFRSTFAALEVAFDGQFARLFGGGFARLVLTDPGDLSRTGVDIVARPPGKKTQALATLSGGERALAAVALLFAMLEVRPVPFCVLDEVDAALDEANIERFVEALRALARATQFVVITHNRGTIEAADALYGITVDNDAVSRVVSLRVEEARAVASQARRERAAAPGLTPLPG
jgi:chromosome segregation protein